MSYVFRLHPPLECDDNYCHLNLMLTDEHLLYKKVTIMVHDPEGVVSQLFVNSLIAVRKEGDTWIVDGTSPKDALLEMEMLLSPAISSAMDGFPKSVPDVKNKTLSVNSKYFILSLLSYALKAMVLLFPVVLAFIYYKFGKEKFFIIPKFLSFVPRNRKPWLVNLVFRKDPFDYDENGFYATILDLHRREIIKIESRGERKFKIKMKGYDELDETEPEGLSIRLLKGHDALDDEYEIKVLRFLKHHSMNDVFDTSKFEEKIDRLRDRIIEGSSTSENELRDIRDEMKAAMKVPTKKAADEFVMSGKKYAWMIFGIFSFVLVATSFLFFFGVFTSIVLLLQSIPPLFVSSALFGRWEENYYKEKLEWDAFKTMLLDFTSIKKYVPEDIMMWQEWLVYAAALGVGNKVVEAMKELKMEIPEVRVATDMPIYFRETYSLTSPPSPPPKGDSGGWDRDFGGGGGGGDFVGGGGFGGGGGGAR